ncbi:MAG: oligopeptide transporter, OPT family [Flavobacteriales bacterium]|nr:oligopeptide transporter, OPT family [Flavobacteriales bacterium]
MNEEKDEQKFSELPENAFRELNPGEEYKPVMSPDKNYPEVTFWSVSWGIVMAVIFSAAAAFLGLKVGQVFEAAIPIAIIAVGLASATKRKNALGENVIIQSIGACSGVIVAGAIFTLPALYILQKTNPELTVNFMEVFISSLLGGILGILFLIPFRKYFVKDMHGKYPFPEATATTQVLISGEKGGNQAFPLIIAGLVGGLYDFILSTFGWWSEVLTTKILPFGTEIADKAKAVFKINTGAAVLGLGYIVGLKYSSIICAGSIFVWFIVIPLIGLVFPDFVASLSGTATGADVAAMAPEAIFKDYARHIGIGGIAMAGVIGIIRSWGIIKGAVGLAGREFSGKKESAKATQRTDRDLSMKTIMVCVAIALVATFVFFQFGIIHNWVQSVIAFIVVVVIAFLFTTVAANAIAIVGSNPVSGMTLMTLILASVILVSVGLKGTSGMVAALIIGGVVCTALSMAGGFITDLKIGYWLGSTPSKQQTWKFLGTLVSAATVGGVIMILNKTYGFDASNGGLVAPQANAMAAVIEPMMSGKSAPWALYGIGAVLSIILTYFKVPALAFALGMFIPLELNTPLVVGGLVSWYVSTRSQDASVNKQRMERGTLLASGFIAGGALMAVVSAGLRFANFEYTNQMSEVSLQALGLLMYLLLIIFLIWYSMRKEKTQE